MMKPIALALTVATLALAGCAPAPGPEPISNQSYGGKYGNKGAHGHNVVTRGAYRCPKWANTMHRGDMYCLK